MLVRASLLCVTLYRLQVNVSETNNNVFSWNCAA